MASRRGLGSLSSLIHSLTRLATGAGGAPHNPSMQQLPTLTSLYHLAWTQPANALEKSMGATRAHSSAPAAGAPAGEAAVVPGPADSLQVVRSRIFGTYIGNGLRSGRKVLRQKLLGPTLVAYYPEEFGRRDPFMLDLQAERAKLKLDRLRRRGKAPPKKGAGKRAGKKK